MKLRKNLHPSLLQGPTRIGLALNRTGQNALVRARTLLFRSSSRFFEWSGALNRFSWPNRASSWLVWFGTLQTGSLGWYGKL